MTQPKEPTLLILPGWQDSGDDHWQGIWLKKFPNAIKVEQQDWNNPRKDDWVQTLNEYVKQHAQKEIILVGHSLACATVAHWSKEHGDILEKAANIKGALLVCPSDVDAADFPKEIQGFSPMPLEPLPFKTIVVTSENDRWVPLERAQFFAQHWGAELINIGSHGHINTAAGFGDWPQGQKILQELSHPPAPYQENSKHH